MLQLTALHHPQLECNGQIFLYRGLSVTIWSGSRKLMASVHSSEPAVIVVRTIQTVLKVLHPMMFRYLLLRQAVMETPHTPARWFQ